MMDSLWGEEFKVEETPKVAKKIVEKINNPKGTVKTKGSKKVVVPLEEQMKIIKENVYRILGKYKDNTVVIRTKEQLNDYIQASIENGIIAIDTETNNSLDPITCKLMGPCIYTPGQKNAYIPINHINPHTRERLEWQLTEEDIFEAFDKLGETLIVMHNGKFDYQVIKCTTGKQLKVYWDTMIATRILNENEKRAGLKEQYIDKVDSSIEKYSIEHLFEGLEYAIFDPELFALYAATDAYMTYKLYLWQKKQFDKVEHQKLYSLFLNVEMPVMEVAAEMELYGIEIDKEYSQRLSDKYHKMLSTVQESISNQLDEYKDVIAKWRLTDEANFHPRSTKPDKNGEYKLLKSKSEQLKDPPELTSPTQFSILLYDVLKAPVVDKKNPRGTGEDILKKIEEKTNNPLCSLVLKQRGIDKLIGTYIDKLPACVNEKTGRLHAHFNQLGTETGRFSSSDPNLQNIPSHEKAIRMMFKAKAGYVMVGSDFSQQEPRLLASYANDDNMIGAYKQGKDLYATIASGVYRNDYWDNMEHYEDGTPNPAGKKRRSSVKSLLLGIMYGRGVSSIAEQIGGTIQEAQKIVDDFYLGFPKVKKWIDETYVNAKTNGYVEDMWGRRRRLSDIQLPKYEVFYKDETSNPTEFNPILGALNIVKREVNPKIVKYEKLLSEATDRKSIESIKDKAKKEGVTINDNGGFISRAERQCVNARVQGGAATMSKKAMIKVHHDEELKNLGFRLMLAVHDELIGECPVENADKVADRLCELMKSSALPECITPFKCDPTIESVWYETDYSDNLRQSYEKLCKTMTFDEALQQLYITHSECTEERIHKFLQI
jgi:DNA polymerase I-like protein with 3'-5' exonuclease and polymerase domains